jgi:polar amino acid transport system substrate-binding protein
MNQYQQTRIKEPDMTRFSSFSARIVTLCVFICGLVMVQAAAAGPALSRIQERGELVLGTSGNMPPMSQKLEDGRVVGFDVDLARLMASGMDVKLNIKTMPFSALLPALQNGDVDVVISNVTMNPERNMNVAFVGPYMTSGKCVITREERLARALESENLNVPETRLAALQGSTSAEFLKVLLPDATLTLVEDYDAGVKLISDGKVGGILTDYPICLSMLKNYPDAGFVSLFTLLSYEPIGIAIPGGDPLYINWTENFLQRVEGTGLLEELAMRWFGRPISEAENNGAD